MFFSGALKFVMENAPGTMHNSYPSSTLKSQEIFLGSSLWESGEISGDKTHKSMVVPLRLHSLGIPQSLANL